MNAVTKILNALSFANVNNLGEFRALLRQIDQPSAAGQDQAQNRAVSAPSAPSSVAAEFRHAPGAL
jgi:hypothetical protein